MREMISSGKTEISVFFFFALSSLHVYAVQYLVNWMEQGALSTKGVVYCKGSEIASSL